MPAKRRFGFETLEKRDLLATLPTGFQETITASGLSSPTAMVQAPDGRFFVAEQGGTLRVVQNNRLLPTPFVSLNVNSDGERGLIGVEVDPRFSTNNYVYVYYTTSTSPIHNRVSRFTANGNTAVANSEVVILDLDNLSGATNHNGGAIHFGNDGKLYVATGDNANGANAQSFTSTHGKILRINPDPANLIPSDNPFVARTAGKYEAIWALGLRNPFTFDVNPQTGRIFVNDVGQSTWEEINEGKAGANYGWPNSEGPTTTAGETSPLYAYRHDTGNPTGIAITGGTFYAPANFQFPASYRNDYFFTDLGSGWIWRLDAATNTAEQFATPDAGSLSPVNLLTSDDGNLYYLARSTGEVRKISYTNQAPVMTGVTGNTSYIEPVGNTSPQFIRLFPQGNLTDDAGNLAGGKLIIHFTTPARAADRVKIMTDGSLTTAGNEVRYLGVPFGTFSGTMDFTVSFNANASPTRVTQLLRHIGFANTSETPSTAMRSMNVQVTDGRGKSTGVQVHTITVAARDDAPTVTPSQSTRNYVRNSAAVGLFTSTAQARDVDSTQFTKLALTYTQGSSTTNRITVTGAFRFNNQQLLYNGVVVGQRNANGGLNGTALTITFNANMTKARVSELLNSLRFSTVGATGAMRRTIQGVLTSASASGGGSASDTFKSFVNVTNP